ncbi:DUF4192 domain-containing protein [Nonomuraea sp. NEAU-A123]|uniref:DUF4192 domain-containing protein n=1 Tax=Nonomuraea sp. NEAU-A123 TaxID=2839649 RepID=UPI001BE43686|nr:DUF4192 domain-containing protein [Nonomuraea sp. NEAU-A123]MBT2233218.1 DUF4192 family protein [Nonomuraea sp. NEAU-A123]
MGSSIDFDGVAIIINRPADLLAAVPYLLGFHPSDCFLMAAIDDSRLAGLARFDLPDGSEDIARVARSCTDVLRRQSIPSAVLIGYGPGQRITPTMDSVCDALAIEGLEVVEMLRCEDGRYWSYACSDPGCCPPEGVPYDVTSHPIAATAVANGAVAFPSRDALVDLLAPVTGHEREEMREATALARARAHALLETKEDTYWFIEGLRHVGACFDHVDAGRPIPADEVAWLGVLLTGILVRDIALTFAAKRDYDVCRQFWTEVTRRVEPAYAPAPATNLAALALEAGDGVLARIAANRALDADAGYRFATMISYALDIGMTPASFAGMDITGQEEAIMRLAAEHPIGARPILPPVPEAS